MTSSPQAAPAPSDPVTELSDPRAITLLTTEHWSLLSSRSLAYNEAFTRGGMFLSFLSMSFVALALLAQAMSFGDQFLTVTAAVLLFDLVVGLATYWRIMGANEDDLRAVHGMARIRHAYAQISPEVARHFTTPIHDDIDSLLTVYGAPTATWPGILYGLTTSGGMIGLITSMVGGLLLAVLALVIGVAGGVAFWIAVGGTLLSIVLLYFATANAIPAYQARLGTMFPAPKDEPAPPSEG